MARKARSSGILVSINTLNNSLAKESLDDIIKKVNLTEKMSAEKFNSMQCSGGGLSEKKSVLLKVCAPYRQSAPQI